MNPNPFKTKKTKTIKPQKRLISFFDHLCNLPISESHRLNDTLELLLSFGISDSVNFKMVEKIHRMLSELDLSANDIDFLLKANLAVIEQFCQETRSILKSREKGEIKGALIVDRRRYNRYSSSYPIQLELANMTGAGSLLDIGRGGAQIKTRIETKNRSNLILNLPQNSSFGPSDILGEIIQQDNEFVRIHFMNLISEEKACSYQSR